MEAKKRRDLFENAYVCFLLVAIIVVVISIFNFNYDKMHSDTMLHYVATRAYLKNPAALLHNDGNDPRITDMYGHTSYPPGFRILNMPFIWNPSILSFIVAGLAVVLLWIKDPKAAVFIGTSSIFLYWSGQADTGIFVGLFAVIVYFLLDMKKDWSIGIAGLLAGFSVLVKPMFSYLMLPAGIVFIFFNADWNRMKKIKLIALFAILFLIFPSIWGIEMFLETGNPFYPIFEESNLPSKGTYIYRGNKTSIGDYYNQRVKPYEDNFGEPYSFLQVDLIFYLAAIGVIFYPKKTSFEWVFGAGIILLFIAMYVTRPILGQYFQVRYLLVAWPCFALFISSLYSRIKFRLKDILVLIFIISSVIFSFYLSTANVLPESLSKIMEFAAVENPGEPITGYSGWLFEYYTSRPYVENAADEIKGYEIHIGESISLNTFVYTTGSGGRYFWSNGKYFTITADDKVNEFIWRRDV